MRPHDPDYPDVAPVTGDEAETEPDCPTRPTQANPQVAEA